MNKNTSNFEDLQEFDFALKSRHEDAGFDHSPYIYDASQAMSAWWFAKARRRKHRDQATADRSKTLTAKVSRFITSGKTAFWILGYSDGSKTLIEISGHHQTRHIAQVPQMVG